MKTLATRIPVVLAALLLGACATVPGPDPATEKRIAALEAKVGTLENRNTDLALKARIMGNHLWGSPLDNFFAADEFWENPYDSGQADCSRRCIATLTETRRACARIADESRRLQCYREAAEQASRCHRQCSASHPPPIP